SNDLKQQIRKYQKEVQTSMNSKPVTTFDGTNYPEWKIGILADAEVIGGLDILTKKQKAPPEGLTTLENERWEYAVVSLAEERMDIMRELTTLHIKDNGYVAFQRRFRYLVARHKELTTNGPEDFYHDLFLIGLREHQKAFVQTRLDDFYKTGQDPICNIGIDDLMNQLANRHERQHR
ncbi:hypothetical protein ACJ72_07758, partial [Emergomyces africanus]